MRLAGAAVDQGEMGDVCLMALMVLAGVERRAGYDSDEGDGQWQASGAIPGVNRFEVLDDEDLQGQPPPPIWRYCEQGEPRDLLKRHLRGLALVTLDHLESTGATMVADVLTKPLDARRYATLRDAMMGRRGQS